MSVVDLFLVNCCFNYHFPQLLIIVAQVVEFFGQAKQHPLVVNNFILPLLDQDLFILSVQEIVEMTALYLSVVAERNHQLPYLLSV